MMKCLRCQEEMKHYKLSSYIKAYGKEQKGDNFYPTIQLPHSPQSIFICDCGYAELSTKECTDPAI